MEALLKSDEGHLINTSSVNGFWASLGDGVPHTSYSAAKFAVKGFSEAMLNDFKVNAPHLNVSLVMPGHIGTDISQNTGIILGKRPEDLDDNELQLMKEGWMKAGAPIHNLSLEVFREAIIQRQDDFKNNALTSAQDAAKIILDGVKKNQWRFLVGPDAEALDSRVFENREGRIFSQVSMVFCKFSSGLKVRNHCEKANGFPQNYFPRKLCFFPKR